MFAIKRSNSDNKVHIEGVHDLVMPPSPPGESSTSPSSSPISQLPSPPKSPSTPVQNSLLAKPATNSLQRRGSGVWTATGNNTIISPLVSRREMVISFSSSADNSRRELSKDDLGFPLQASLATGNSPDSEEEEPQSSKSPSPPKRKEPGVWTATGNNTISPFVNRHEMEISFPSSESKEKDENFNRTVDECYNHTLPLITDLLKKKKSNNVQMEPTKILVKPVVNNTPRPQQPPTYNSEQLEPVDIPSDPDFSFLQNSDKNMIESAYHTVNRMEKWDYLRRYSPSKDTGYMFDRDPTIGEITNAINDNWDGGHSGCSMGCTMRRIQYIAENGFEKFKQDYLYN